MRVKYKVYRAVVFTSLMFGAETWIIYRKQIERIYAYKAKYSQQTMHLSPLDNLLNEET